jgi:hypothetical protein
VEVINVPARILKPRRFDIIMELRGVTWRRIQVEVAPDEAGIGDWFEAVEPTPLDRFGLPDPDVLVGIAMRFQIAQKLHAASDPHDPPVTVNDRARDVTDLLLLRDLVRETGMPTLVEIKQAGVAVFESRAAEVTQLGLPAREWPPVLTAYPHWEDDYRRAAESADITLTLPEAVAEANSWLDQIDAAK